MSVVTYDAVPGEAAAPAMAAPAMAAPVRKGIFARLLDALIEAQTRRAEIEVARYRRIMPDA